MPPGRPGRGTPEGMKAASRTASRTTGDGAPITAYPQATNREEPLSPAAPIVGSRAPASRTPPAPLRGRAAGPVPDPAQPARTETGSSEGNHSHEASPVRRP